MRRDFRIPIVGNRDALYQLYNDGGRQRAKDQKQIKVDNNPHPSFELPYPEEKQNNRELDKEYRQVVENARHETPDGTMPYLIVVQETMMSTRAILDIENVSGLVYE